jgi:hypothetical protein
MAFAIKAEVCSARAKTFAFTAQKTMYGPCLAGCCYGFNHRGRRGPACGRSPANTDRYTLLMTRG